MNQGSVLYLKNLVAHLDRNPPSARDSWPYDANRNGLRPPMRFPNQERPDSASKMKVRVDKLSVPLLGRPRLRNRGDLEKPRLCGSAIASGSR